MHKIRIFLRIPEIKILYLDSFYTSHTSPVSSSLSDRLLEPFKGKFFLSTLIRNSDTDTRKRNKWISTFKSAENSENERSLSLSLTYCVKAAPLLLFIDRLYSTRIQSRSLEILRRNIFFSVVSRLMKHTYIYTKILIYSLGIVWRAEFRSQNKHERWYRE